MWHTEDVIVVYTLSFSYPKQFEMFYWKILNWRNSCIHNIKMVLVIEFTKTFFLYRDIILLLRLQLVLYERIFWMSSCYVTVDTVVQFKVLYFLSQWWVQPSDWLNFISKWCMTNTHSTHLETRTYIVVIILTCTCCR